MPLSTTKIRRSPSTSPSIETERETTEFSLRLQALALGYISQLLPAEKESCTIDQNVKSQKARGESDYFVINTELTGISELKNGLAVASTGTKERPYLIFWKRSEGDLGCRSELGARSLVQCIQSAGWSFIVRKRIIVWPHSAGRVSKGLNRILSPLLPFLCHAEVWIARRNSSSRNRSCSIIIPARNEAGNIPELLDRLPRFGTTQEVLIIEGGSSDKTLEVAHQEVASRPEQEIKVLEQTEQGKGSAVRQALKACRGELVFILDADLSVSPEILPVSYRAICSQEADFINGNRFAHRMEDGAMRPLNWLGNRFFAVLMSLQLGLKLSDTLCGTKVFYRDDFCGQEDDLTRHDPFGDFSLLIGAAHRYLAIKELPVHYHARTYGRTNIRRWRDGLTLLGIMIRALAVTHFIAYEPATLNTANRLD